MSNRHFTILTTSRPTAGLFFANLYAQAVTAIVERLCPAKRPTWQVVINAGTPGAVMVHAFRTEADAKRWVEASGDEHSLCIIKPTP